MKQIWKYLQHHWKEDFSLKQYGLIAVILVVLIVFNYSIDFEDSILDKERGLKKFGYYFLFYAIPYYTVLLITCDYSKSNVWKTPAFFFKSIFALAILSLDSSLPFVRSIISGCDPKVYLWLYKVTVNAISLVTVLLPLLLYYIFLEKNKIGFYGLTTKRFDYRPYFQMLIIMLPLLLAATLLPGFLKQYPMYKTSEAHTFLGVSEWVTALIYEVVYGFDFITVELFFRGFLVIGMIHHLGRKSVLAMAIIYCLLHFGKPAGEAISSVFGGYILGVIAYETKSIWGGIIVHVGIAWMMELVSYTTKQLNP